MPPIEFGPARPPALRAVSAVETRPVAVNPAEQKAATGTPAANATARSHASANSAVQRSAALDPGPAPVDLERVAMIRKAIEHDKYPLLPARVADAMIAAGMLLGAVK